MGTTSSIAIEQADGSVLSVYCHWDGDLSWNGRVLKEFYNTPERTLELIQLGNLSSLDKNISAEQGVHTFDNPQPGVCVFYGRDRGEADQDPELFASYAEYIENETAQNYNYIMRNGEWYVDRNHLGDEIEFSEPASEDEDA